ncbi:Surfactin synthase thioesterase subunit [Asanoa hainanensis]|uniref:Surfactin synthase thioesterase subunit n=1 Tax=Asanoa hainanensis TaxID=560556 RepID=A0A239N0F0_9ACTN|nr:thioesterase domain-containing protein [Asanoa hainanensis]SNT48507.1 Surfactin synthase thioesterase subunit [Asanoa hainanensis]
MTTTLSQNAIVRLGQPRSAAVRLVCVPHAGGGTATFRPLSPELPPRVDLCAVRLPGRESRRREPALHRMDEIVAEIVQGLEQLDDLPVALLGYCSGAISAYAVASELVDRGRPPVRLIAVASPGPRVVAPDRWMHNQDHDTLVDYLRRSGVTPELILADASLFAMFEPGVRADFETFETWEYEPGARLDLPITAIGANEDTTVDLGDLLMWRDQTSREFTLRMLPGGHDFLGAATGWLGRTLATELLGAAAS